VEKGADYKKKRAIKRAAKGRRLTKKKKGAMEVTPEEGPNGTEHGNRGVWKPLSQKKRSALRGDSERESTRKGKGSRPKKKKLIWEKELGESKGEGGVDILLGVTYKKIRSYS